MSFIKVVAVAFAVYIGSCVYFERVRSDFPDKSIQPNEDQLSDTQRDSTMQTAITNLIIGGLLFAMISRWVRLDKSCGLMFVELLKLAVMLFMADTMFYWSHRMLHIPEIYRVAHAQHHSHHEPIAWTSLYVHPIEFVVAFVGIFAVPLLMFRMHPLTATMFLSLIMLSLTSSHSGLKCGVYQIFDATHHDLHHQRRRGNYGSDVGVWDRICGTRLESSTL